MVNIEKEENKNKQTNNSIKEGQINSYTIKDNI
jgi:hypothetical protein